MLLAEKHICWNITTRCNATCPFCHRMNHIRELPIELNQIILGKLLNAGVRKITWTGGEALLYKDLKPLLSISKENGVHNHLITNGIALNSTKIDSLNKLIDSVTLSLDSCDSETNEQMGRGFKQYDTVSEIIQYISTRYNHIQLKLNTVACKINLSNISEISNFVVTNGIERWKIFRFMDLRGDAISNKDKYWITSEEFLEIQKSINSILAVEGFSGQSFVDVDSLQEDYILIRADGAVVVTRNKNDVILGNLLFDDMVDIFIRNKELF